MSLRVPEGLYLADPTLGEKCGAIVVRALDPTPRRILDLAAVWQPAYRCWFAAAALPDDGPAAMAASLGMDVVLESDATWDDGVLEALAEYFLYSPTLEASIDPFAFVAMAMADGSGRDLWMYYAEALGRNFYVDPAERVTLSPRWAKAGRFFGTARDDLETLQASELWQHLATLRHRTFAGLTPCATCRHYPWCAGFWKAIDTDADCSQWQASFDIVFEAWRATRETP